MLPPSVKGFGPTVKVPFSQKISEYHAETAGDPSENCIHLHHLLISANVIVESLFVLGPSAEKILKMACDLSYVIVILAYEKELAPPSPLILFNLQAKLKKLPL